MDFISASLMFEYTSTKKTVENYRKLYSAIGASVDEDALASFIKKTEDMNIEEILEKGNSIVESIALQVASSRPQADSKPSEEKKEETKVEEEEEAVEVDLFGGDDDLF
ncbi:60S acidic ribosomal protein P2 (RLA2) [Vairimorpha necatrix]|uniref:60S acidic ribosomal protein P2 (RLA2) n=1 Tax=Vairimorpha necatrix TaxID=6039 RepID=A0AAX4JAW2_9MICR